MQSARTFTKTARGAESAARLRTEAAGLDWLRAAGGAAVPQVVAVDDHELVLPLLPSAQPSAKEAESFGAELATTHGAGAEAFGELAPGSEPVDGHTWIGLAELPRGASATWGPFYGACRVEPYLAQLRAAGALSRDDSRVFDALVAGLARGDERICGPNEPVARIHGDLWSGNVVWSVGAEAPSDAAAASAAHGRMHSPGGGRVRGWLIDPCAHGGHRETDLAMLGLFGAPHLDRILAGYQESSPLADGWRERVPVHQLHPLLVHACLFGGGYVHQALETARRALALSC